MMPFTTPNIVATPQMPSARTMMARAQNDFSLMSTRRPTRMSCETVSAIMVYSL